MSKLTSLKEDNMGPLFVRMAGEEIGTTTFYFSDNNHRSKKRKIATNGKKLTHEGKKK